MEALFHVLLIVVASSLLSAFGASIGLVLGHLRLPLIILYQGSPAGGASTNLAISTLTSLAGVLRHAREGRVSWRMLAVIGIPSAAGAYFSARMAVHFPPAWINLIIGSVLALSGLSLVRETGTVVEETTVFSRKVQWLVEILIGAGLGVIAGVVGLMLGSLRLPAMIRVLRMDPRIAVGTNMAIGCLTGVFGSIGALSQGNVDWVLMAIVAPPTILAAHLGAGWTARIDRKVLVSLVGTTVIAVGLGMVGYGVWLSFR